MSTAEFDASVNAECRRLARDGDLIAARENEAQAYEAMQIADREADIAVGRAHNAEREWNRAMKTVERLTRGRREGDV